MAGRGLRGCRGLEQLKNQKAIILAGGKAERLGAAAGGRPKALVPIAGRPLAAYQVALLASAGVERVIVSCSAGTEDEFSAALAGLGAEIVTAAEPEPLGRGGGLRFAAAARREGGDIFALNGDELLDLDLGAMLARHRETGAAATIAVAPLKSPFGERSGPLRSVAVDLRPKTPAPAREAGNLPQVREELLHLASQSIDRVLGHRRMVATRRVLTRWLVSTNLARANARTRPTGGRA